MLFKREKYLKKIRPFYNDDDIIKVITGIRRCGKSSLMSTIADELRDKGIKEDNIIFLDLDSRKYRKIKDADSLENLICSKIKDTERKYLFIDEIQNVTGFEEVINGFRTDGNISIFITGSNSYLLSGELVTKLTGRYIEFEMFTLSFDEYEQIKQFYGKPISPNPSEELNRYITEGGFPRTILIDEPDAKRTYVESVINEIFEKDIRKRIKIRDFASFEIIRNYLIGNFGATSSIKSLSESLVKNGITVSRATVARYIQALTDAKIFYPCDRFDIKSKKALQGEKKYYLADLGFYFAINTDNRINYGPVLENIVYIYSRSLGYAVSIGKIGKLECDFIVRDIGGDYSYIQVSYTVLLNRETEDREFAPLENIRDNYKKYVATTDYILQKRNGILHINLIDFMRDGKEF